MLEFNIKNQTISRVDRFNPATDSVDYLTAKFNFLTTDWDGITKKALFRSGTVSYEAAINASGVCTVPWEVLVSPENKFSTLSGGCIKIFVSVAGTSGTIQIPTKECRVEIGVSGLNETLNGAEPTPNVYEQFVDTIKADNDVTVAEIKADNDETRAEVEALTERTETAAEDIKAYDESIKNNYANALKGTASGEVVRVDDVSPVEHTAKVKISGNVDPSTVTLTRCGKNLWNVENESQLLDKLSYDRQTQIFTVNRVGLVAKILTFAKPLPIGTTVSITLKMLSGQFSDGFLDVGGYHSATEEGVSSTWQGTAVCEAGVEFNGQTYKNTFTATDTITDLVIFIDANVIMSKTVKFQVQFEIGETATDYEEYNGATYTPNADGTCDIVSVSPTMTLLTDTEGVTIDLEYNRDTTAVMGDLKACLDEVKAIHQTTLDLLGGAS